MHDRLYPPPPFPPGPERWQMHPSGIPCKIHALQNNTWGGWWTHLALFDEAIGYFPLGQTNESESVALINKNWWEKWNAWQKYWLEAADRGVADHISSPKFFSRQFLMQGEKVTGTCKDHNNYCNLAFQSSSRLSNHPCLLSYLLCNLHQLILM